MQRYIATTSKGQLFTVLARGIDDAAWVAAKSLNDGESIVRVQLA